MGSPYFTSPTSYRLTQMAQDAYEMPFVALTMKPHESHPPLGHLVLLVFEAVLEVVCVSFPGYLIARLGHFDAEKQKFLANLNVMLFTPCLIFTKLASQLNADKLADLAIIPVIFFLQTLVSFLASSLVARAFSFNKRASNFVIAMGVFGNSNSLPISLVLSLSQTLKGLHWDRIPGDNDDEVGARGILYLMIFQQLGQLVRWSWGYHVLLAPKEKYAEYQQEIAEEGRYEDAQDENLLIAVDGDELTQGPGSEDLENYEPAGRTPVAGASRTSLADSEDEDDDGILPKKSYVNGQSRLDANHPLLSDNEDDILSFPRIRNADEPEITDGLMGYLVRIRVWFSKRLAALRNAIMGILHSIFNVLPRPVQIFVRATASLFSKLNTFLWEFMNPPLWAMLIAVIIASVPSLQHLFFEEGSFINNSVSSAIKSSGGVAVPLILVVLGANLARNTQERDGRPADPEEERIGKKLLVAALVSRMVLPTLIMAPILAVMAKYVPVSILDDPIFIIVCFLLTGAPSALQLAQICQINEVFDGVMSKILFQSYVIWILPSTLVLVMSALEVLEWARPL